MDRAEQPAVPVPLSAGAGSAPASFVALLAGDVVVAARGLLGARLVREDRAGLRVGRIVEVEAYGGPEDTASHARSGRTARNAAMFGPPGRAYVYAVYGMHACLNVVAGPAGAASAILVRAAVPLAGEPAMRQARLARAIAARRADRAAPAAAAARIAGIAAGRLAMGPGNLAAAFSIDRSDDGCDLLDASSPLRLETARDGEAAGFGKGAGYGERVLVGPRVGVAYAGGGWADRPWRFRLVAALAGTADRGRAAGEAAGAAAATGTAAVGAAVTSLAEVRR